MGSVSGRRKAALLWIMLTALIVLEAADVAMMAMHGQIPGAVTHVVLAILFAVIIGPAILRFGTDAALWLMAANLALLIIIAVHDFDHMRQAMAWGYTFTIPLLIVNFIVYVPGALAFVLASRRPVAGAVATTVAGPLIAIAFLKLHLLGAWVPVWGPWNEPFTVLGVDTLSWAILWITAVLDVARRLPARAFGRGARGRRNGVVVTVHTASEAPSDIEHREPRFGRHQGGEDPSVDPRGRRVDRAIGRNQPRCALHPLLLAR